jgi:hypothetical protein
MIRVGERAVAWATASLRRARCSTTIAPTGGKPTPCLLGMSLMFGTERARRCRGCRSGGLRIAAAAQIVWVKQHFTLSRGDYHWKHECCSYAVRRGKKSHWQGDRTQTTVWEIANNNPCGNRHREQSWGHGTQKPVECMRRPIVNNSRPGQLVHDPFLGSGTTLIAAELKGGLCCGLEISRPYCRCDPATLASLHRADCDPSSLGSIV